MPSTVIALKMLTVLPVLQLRATANITWLG